jgi:hypothetical protein
MYSDEKKRYISKLLKIQCNIEKEIRINEFIKSDPILRESVILIKDVLESKLKINEKVLVYEEAVCDLTIFSKNIYGNNTSRLHKNDILYIINILLEIF